MKNLAEVETRTKKRSAGDTLDSKSLIFDFAWQLKKQGYKGNTVKSYTTVIKALVRRGADLLDPESVKAVLARTENWSESTKSTATRIYSTFLVTHGLSWTEPCYRQQQKLPFIPTEKEIDDLIANCGTKTSKALRIAKETGARIGEIANLKWIDIDKEKRLLIINEPEKGSNPRILPISAELISVLERLPKKDEYVFTTGSGPTTAKHLASLLWGGRKSAARKLGNPRLLKITYHTLRHWKATMEYHRTKDILHVKELLGHKNIQNTMIYINLEKALFKTSDENFTVRAVDDLEEACSLLEVGFEYVCDMDGKKLFRKRK
jgi:integrase